MPKGNSATSTDLTETVRAMKLPVHCKNRKNGCHEIGEEKEIEKHEVECEFRILNFWRNGGKKVMFKDLLFRANEIVQKYDGNWILANCHKDNKTKYHEAQRHVIEPDGQIFRIILNANYTIFMAYVLIIGGEHVANKYRVEMRLGSGEKEFTTTHHGPVFSVDVNHPGAREEAFTVDRRKFGFFNKGYEYFGEHNKDKNGEITVPISVKIIKKELEIPKGDMDDGEK